MNYVPSKKHSKKMSRIQRNLRVDHLELQRELCRRSLAYFAREAWPLVEPGREYIHGWHIDAVCEHLEAVTKGRIRNLLINMPPRHMKSLLVSVFWPVWVWTFKPETRWLFSSYAESLSMRDSVKCRRIIQSSWYQKRFGYLFQLTGDQNEKRRFDNNKTGYRIATSVAGAGTGEGGDVICCDDAHKVGDAGSDAMRESVLEWWDAEMSSRGNDPKTVAKVIVMQRVHEADLAGHVLEQGGYEHLCLPAEYEGRKIVTSIGWSDPREKIDELLWPERFGPDEIAEAKKRMGSKEAAGQLQQRPAPADGHIVHRDWWQFWKELPDDFDKVCLSADLAFKDGEHSDYTVFQIWGRKGANKYLLDQIRARMSFTESLRVIEQLLAKWPSVKASYIEDAANSAALIDTLHSKVSGLIPVKPNGSKLARAQSVSPEIESHNVWLPDPTTHSFVNDFIEEWATFPFSRNDDQVDACSLAFSKLNEPLIDYSFDLSLVTNLTQPSKWKSFA